MVSYGVDPLSIRKKALAIYIYSQHREAWIDKTATESYLNK